MDGNRHKLVKSLFALVLAFVLALPSGAVFASSGDQFILSDPVNNTYYGRAEAFNMRFNLMFEDLADYSWASESIARMGALDLIKGTGNQFRPAELVTRADAISHIMRGLGFERQALTEVTAIQAQMPPGVTTEALIELSYLYFAQSAGVITRQEYDDALFITSERQMLFNSLGAGAAEEYAPEVYMFDAQELATREEIALWIYLAMQTLNSALWETPESIQALYGFGDWTDIAPEALLAAEAMLANGIMGGSDGLFLPKENVNRAVLAVVLRGLNDIYNGTQGIERKSGVVTAVTEGDMTQVAEFTVDMQISVRTADGNRDMLMFQGSVEESGAVAMTDAVVFKDYEIQGLQSLKEGDMIEYLVTPYTLPAQVLYVQVLGEGESVDIEGVLNAIDFNTNTITIQDIFGVPHSYSYANGISSPPQAPAFFTMHGIGDSIDGFPMPLAEIPYSHRVKLSLFGNVVMKVTYLGLPVAVAEGSGIVLENNPAFGFMTILLNSGESVVYRYYQNDMEVRRRDYYETFDDSGFAQLFPTFRYDPLVSTIDAVQPGELVFFRTDTDDPTIITDISAVTNYTVRHGRVVAIVPKSGFLTVQLEFEDGRGAFYDIANGILVISGGGVVMTSQIRAGDWLKLLVNRAVTAPGVVTETAIEIHIEGPERHISTLIKGQLQDYDSIQNRLVLENSFVLDRNLGWVSYNNLRRYDLSARDIEYYLDGVQISRDAAVTRLKRSNATAYVALEQSHLGDRVKMVSFRDNLNPAMPRNAALDMGIAHYPNIVTSSVNGVITTPNGTFNADDGTIVVRHGRLAGQRDIYAGDYVSIVENGPNQAAIVEVADIPDTSALKILRGYVVDVNDLDIKSGKNAQFLYTMALLGTYWTLDSITDPIITVDYQTVFMNGEGYADPSSFIAYGADSVLNDPPYTIIASGSRALFIVRDIPYQPASKIGAVRGRIYANDGFERISLRDAEYRAPNGIWRAVTPVAENILDVAILPNSLILGNNEVIGVIDEFGHVTPKNLNVGEYVEIMIEPLDPLLPPGGVVNGYIIRVVPAP